MNQDLGIDLAGASDAKEGGSGLHRGFFATQSEVGELLGGSRAEHDFDQSGCVPNNAGLHLA